MLVFQVEGRQVRLRGGVQPVRREPAGQPYGRDVTGRHAHRAPHVARGPPARQVSAALSILITCL